MNAHVLAQFRVGVCGAPHDAHIAAEWLLHLGGLLDGCVLVLRENVVGTVRTSVRGDAALGRRITQFLGEHFATVDGHWQHVRFSVGSCIDRIRSVGRAAPIVASW
jgi:hypothetical protein